MILIAIIAFLGGVAGGLSVGLFFITKIQKEQKEMTKLFDCPSI